VSPLYGLAASRFTSKHYKAIMTQKKFWKHSQRACSVNFLR
jgi:hypothetical protein